ncbi:transposase [Bradyrhizobium ottawaense]
MHQEPCFSARSCAGIRSLNVLPRSRRARSQRDFAAWLGLTPLQRSTGCRAANRMEVERRP